MATAPDPETIADLIPDPENLRVHTERNLGVIVASLNEVGGARSLVCDENNVVLAGNGVLEAAAIAGIEKVKVVDATGHELVVVRRSGLTDLQKKRLALYDNRSAELAVWDAAGLVALEVESQGMLRGMWNASELAELEAQAKAQAIAAEADADDPPAKTDHAADLRDKWSTKIGQIWQAGRHRLMCGDSTSRDDVSRLMDGHRAALVMTDPPYGVDYSDIVDSRINQKIGGWKPLANDLSSDLAPLLRSAFAVLRDVVVRPNAAWFLWHPAGANASVFRDALSEAGVNVHKQIVWIKERFVFGRWEYHWQHEPCYYGWLAGNHPPFYGDRSESTVWAVDRDAGYTGDAADGTSDGYADHPTQKPPELWRRAIRNHTLSGEIVYDAFAGSGPVYVAAERENRVAYAIDIDPSYVAVCLERLADLGLDPRLVA